MEIQNRDDGRKLPVIEIAGAEFYVDGKNGILIDTCDQNNIITPFDMCWADDHYEMLFDKEKRNSKTGDWFEWESERHEYIWLRPLEVYDPEGAMAKLGHEAQLIPKNLPVIEIEGVQFLWDRTNTRLLQKDMPYNQITKNDMQVYAAGTGCYFDTEKKWVLFPHEVEQLLSAGNRPQHIRFVHQEDIVQRINEQEKLKQATRKGNRIR